MKEDKLIVLKPQEIDYFKYFISEYHRHVENGWTEEARHCCVAVLLELEKMLPEAKDDMSL